MSSGERGVKEILYVRYKSGVSPISILGALYALFIFLPAEIYIYLMTGGTVSIPVGWFTLLFFLELSKYMGRRMTKQEATLLSVLVGIGYIPTSFIYAAWFRSSDIAQYFGLTKYIPDWAAPPPESGILELRTLFHTVWIPVYVVSFISWILSAMVSIGLALFVKEMYLEVERLPFPMVQVSSTAITVLTGEDEAPLRLIGIVSLIGFIWGFVVYGLPFLHQALTGQYVQFIPIPWIDLTRFTEVTLPGAFIGISTGLGTYSSGWIVPFPVVVGIFIASIATWIICNTYVVSNWEALGLPDVNPALPGVQSWWYPGMTIAIGLPRATMFFWFSIFLGLGLAAGLLPLIRHPRILRDACVLLIKPTTKVERRYTEPISGLKVTLPLIICGITGSIVLFAILVPEFFWSNLWIVPAMVGFPIVSTIIQCRSYGETPTVISIPANTLTYLAYYASGYKGVDVWFAPTIVGASGFSWLTTFKLAELTETSIRSLLKVYWLLVPLGIIVGFLYLELFWKMAPIPSGRYPGVAIFWPLSAVNTAIWIKGGLKGLFKPTWILYSFLLGGALYLLLDFTHSPITYIYLASGATTVPPISISFLIGGLIGLIIKRIKGDIWWNKNKLILAAGLIIGQGIAVTLSIAIGLIINSIWMLPF